MIAGLDSDSFGYVALLLALAVFVGGGLLGSYRGRIGSMTRDAVTWLALGLGLVTIYAYKDELMPIAARVVGELLPGSAMTVEQSSGGVTEVRIRKRLDGHFTAITKVNGKSISMIVDTGASTIVLTPEDAKNGWHRYWRAHVSRAGDHRQWPHHRRAGPPQRGRHRPARPEGGRRAGCPARSAHPEPARYEFLKPPALL